MSLTRADLRGYVRTYFDLDIEKSSNAVILQIIFPNEPQLLDLSIFDGAPVNVKFEIPLTAVRRGQ